MRTCVNPSCFIVVYISLQIIVGKVTQSIRVGTYYRCWSFVAFSSIDSLLEAFKMCWRASRDVRFEFASIIFNFNRKKNLRYR